MAWSIADVARMSSTTSRTLRHYHDIGLLVPAFVGDNGYRYYEREQLLRLQQILLLRELDLGLPVIARILAGQQDAASALQLHLRHLRTEQVRLRRLQRTVERTLLDLEEGTTMPVEKFFDGFDAKQQEAYERELVERFGDAMKPAIDESRRRTAGWTKTDFDAAITEYQQGLEQLAALMREGQPAEAPAVQEIIAGHHAWLTQFWTPNRASYTGLGEMYADDPSFRDQIDAVEPGLAGFLSDAMAVYARTRLS